MDKAQIAETAAKMVEAVKASVAAATAPLIARIGELEAQVNALPAPPKAIKGDAGRDCDMAAVFASIKSEVSAQVAKLPPPKDGEPGKDGESVHPDKIALMVREAADKVAAQLPKPKDGRDGFNLEDFSMEIAEDGRSLTLTFQRGEAKIERTIKLETLIYRGVWREGPHERGDVVSWGGSAWHCNEPTEDKPGISSAWRLMVKEGRAGKDATAHAPAAHKPVRVG